MNANHVYMFENISHFIADDVQDGSTICSESGAECIVYRTSEANWILCPKHGQGAFGLPVDGIVYYSAQAFAHAVYTWGRDSD